MKAFVLAAGFGTRLKPLSQELPKPAWPLFGVPLAVHVLAALGRAGVGAAIVNRHHLGAQLEASIRPWLAELPTIVWSPEPEILGTGGALAPWRRQLGEEPFFLVNADTYQELDLSAVAALHRERGALATLALRPLPPGTRGPVELGPEGRIVRLLDARAPGTKAGTPCEFTGVHVLSPAVLERVPDRPACIVVDVHKPLVAAGALYCGHVPPAESFWSDLGTPGRYLEGHRALLHRGRLPPTTAGRLVATGAGAPGFRGPGVEVEADAQVGPFAVLGAGTRICSGARVERAVTWRDAVLGPGTYRDVIVSGSGSMLRARAAAS